jgi:hypothetical protein
MYLKGLNMLGYTISSTKINNLDRHIIKNFNNLETFNNSDVINIVKGKIILYQDDIINNASKYGHFKVLEWLKKSNYEFNYDEHPIHFASKNGHIQILEWFKNSGYELKYDLRAIHNASKNGHVKVLEWFKNYGYNFVYTIYSYINASNRPIVLEWFKNNNYKFNYTRHDFVSHKIKIKFAINNIYIKKIIKYTIIIKKTLKLLKFKTKNNYVKGYNKN